jgi:hypothetical protein
VKWRSGPRLKEQAPVREFQIIVGAGGVGKRGKMKGMYVKKIGITLPHILR